MKNRWQTESKFAGMTQLMVYCLEKLIKNRLITYSIITLLCLSTFCSCHSRTPSDVRLERITEIKLPREFVVLKDEYQDMIQDYCIIYEIKFENQSASKLIELIQQSPYYIQEVKMDNQVLHHTVNQNGQNKFWTRYGNKFNFSGQNGGTSYSIDFDMFTKVLKYVEMYD